MSAAFDLSSDSAERRLHPRASFRGRAWISGMSRSHWARIRDVSPGGVGLEVDAASLRLGSHVDVGFDLPRGGRVVARAVVVRKSTNGVGLRFMDVDRASADALDDFVVRRAA